MILAVAVTITGLYPSQQQQQQNEKAREFQKNIYFCFIDYAKAFDCVHHNKLWKIPKEMGREQHINLFLCFLCPGPIWGTLLLVPFFA